MRSAALVLLVLSLAACNRGNRSNEAVRQGIIDHLKNRAGLNVGAMDVNLTTVDVKGNEADATVSITPKGGNPAQGMTMKYHLQQQGSQWVVTGRQDSPGSPHGAGAAMPGAENPHGSGGAPSAAPPSGGMGAPSGGGKMPSPGDLPPVKKK